MGKNLNRASRQGNLILTEDQVSCLTSPTRKVLMAAFIQNGPATIAEIAVQVDRRPKSLYYHIDLMLSTGLLRVAGQQAGVKKPETIYDAVSNRLQLADGASDSYRNATRKSVQALIRLASRQFDQSDRAGKRPLITRTTVRLSDEDRAAFSLKLRELITWAETRRSDDHPQTHVLLLEIPMA